jgi:hypothetical protein
MAGGPAAARATDANDDAATTKPAEPAATMAAMGGGPTATKRGVPGYKGTTPV